MTIEKPSSERSRSTRRGPHWARLSDESLLDKRFCDLEVALESTSVGARIDQLHDELRAKGLRFRPHCWLSNEWFTPVGIPGIAIPFYLAHPRLERLERTMMLEVEGGTRTKCMQILRHEAGHAIQNAYRLNRRRRWRELFGRSTTPYPDTYQPKPYSRRFVLHIDNWYAQAHPDEDFAETFAVWLTPGLHWRTRYRSWPAIRKLEYVDGLMQEIAGRQAPVRSRRKADPLGSLTQTLREHYRERQSRYQQKYPDFHVQDLRRLFGSKEDRARGTSAATFLRRIRPRMLRLVSRWTGEYQYTIDQVYRDMIESCHELKLRVPPEISQDELTREVAVMLAVQTMNHLHTGGHRLKL